MSAARCVSPALMYSDNFSIWSFVSSGGRLRNSLRSCARTPLLPSSVSGSSFGKMTAMGCGKGASLGRPVIAEVR